MEPSPILIRPMTRADIPAGERLCEIAGWNQTPQDWQRLLSLEPAGCFVAALDGIVRGTVTTTTYGNTCGWIGMVLVDPDYRRFGMGTRLLQTGLSYLESCVQTTKLDATPLGKQVYDRNGFVVEYDLARWEGIASATSAEASALVVQDADLPALIEFDTAAFGCNRGRLLSQLFRTNPSSAFCVKRDGNIAGYIMGRPGRRASYLGPWVANDETIAASLLDTLLAQYSGQAVFIDINLSNPATAGLLETRGLQQQRPFIRMYRGSNRNPGETQLVYGIAGPEVG